LGLAKDQNLMQLLSFAYPEHQWEFSRKSMGSYYKKSQYLLKVCLKTLFPQEGEFPILAMLTYIEILEEYRHPDIEMDSRQFLALDFFYPKYKLAFEYQVKLLGIIIYAYFRDNSILEI
jgi:hypothetical protein